MSQIFRNLVIGLDEDLEEKLKLLSPDFHHFQILRKSVDARGTPHFVYTVEVFNSEEPPPKYSESNQFNKLKFTGSPPLIIGAGPAGLFTALRLVENGIPCHLFEQGSDASSRIMQINQHWRYGKFNPRSNVCFGEGGAGLYSDGKLITRIKSSHIPYVLNRLVKFGAPGEIEYLANPHVGSDRIRRLIPVIRNYLIANGCQVHLNTKIESLICQPGAVVGAKTEDGREFFSDHTVLAIGHSAEDMFNHLKDLNVFMEGKSFAIGLRIEHPQSLINQIQYKQYAQHKKLGAANYKLAHHDHKSGIGVYSFCMCPGGYVISSTTEENKVVCNGMSNFSRNGPFANAAIVVTIDHQKNFGSDIFGGLNFRNKLEQDSYNEIKKINGHAQLPVQNLLAFMEAKNAEISKGSSPSGALAVRIDKILPPNIADKIREGILKFDRDMKGFLSPQAQVYALESRTSCPLRITRDKNTLQSISHKGLYPVGEGAGYAGGITSAAVDGVKAADAIMSLYS